jgi:tocopherol O-methyltransferase
MTWRVPLKEIENFYDSKTQALLHRYGPGPRIHYHAGLFESPEPIDAPPDVLRKHLVLSQDRILQHAAKIWQASSTLSGEVLDAGCGLGGGSLFWAQEFGAHVTAVTIASSHVPLITQFATQAGVASQVQPLAHNVVELPGENRFDAAVAIESSCHMPRQALFQRLAKLLRPGGRFFIADFFFEDPQYEEVWRRHWHAPLGTHSEYRMAAIEAGFKEELTEDVSHKTEHFWTMTAALIQAEADQSEQTESSLKKVEKSLQAHLLTRQGLETGGLRYSLTSFINNN